MDTDRHQPQQTDYGDAQWDDMGGYSNGGGQQQHNSTPMHEYTGYNFTTSPVMPIEPAYTVPRPPPYTAHQQLAPLHPLITMAPWPSMLTSHSQATYSPPVVPTAPLATPLSASTASTVTPVTTTGGSTPRRTLTDDDRRRMCEYHESHPGVKQTEIGAMFGVERSTVSKVLRQKEKFLHSNDGSQSPTKKTKGKFPDIERALANWARNEQRKGEPLNDAKIKEQAQRFAATVGNNESQSKLTNSAWLEKFKQKHNLFGARPRKGHINVVHEPDGILVVDSSTTSLSETPVSYSPESSASGGLVSPPTSPNRDYDVYEDFKAEDGDSFLAYYQNGHSRSTDSMDNDYVGVSAPRVSAAIISPTSPALLNTNGHASPMSAGHLRLPSRSANFSRPKRPRSQTFPNLGVEPGVLLKSESMDTGMPKMSDRSVVSPLLDSAIEESPTAIDPRQTMKRNKSVPDMHSVRSDSMQPPPIPPLPRSQNASPISSSGSPTQDDARKALDLVWSFFQSQPAGLLEPDECATIGKLMVKLKISQSPDGTQVLPGGMYPLDRAVSPRMTKKRKADGINLNERVSGQ